MRQFLLAIAIASITLMACNEIDNDKISTPGKIVEMEIVKMPSDSSKAGLLKITGLSEKELKDDSIFVDGSRPTSWEIAGITDVKGLKLFIKQLQQWVVDNNKEKLSAIVQYPLNKYMKTREDLLTYYDAVFTKEVKLSFATINFSQLFRNEKGVMTDGGRVWLNQQGKEFKITAINYANTHR